MPERCPECGKFKREDQSVCDSCAAKYTRDYNALVSRPDTIQKKTDSQYFEENQIIDSVAVELKKDISYLIDLGIKLDKGTLVAKTGGAAWAGYEVLGGDWLSALLIGGFTLLVGGLTNSYKRIKVTEMQQKWMDRLSDLNQDQLEYLAAGLQRKYPVLMRRFQNLLQAGQQQ
jgi:hypothetical protein